MKHGEETETRLPAAYPPDAAPADVNHFPSAASNSEDESDTELLAGARAGDRSCFGLLVRRYQDDLFALALGLVHARDEAEDLTQETFVKAWRSIRRFRGEARVRTWLWRILINTCRSHLRRRSLRRKLFFWKDTVDPYEETAPQEERWKDTAPGADPERSVERDMLRRRVARARSGLSPREQEVVALKYDQGMKIAEIGELLALSPNTVKVLLFRAMKKMAGELKDLQP